MKLRPTIFLSSVSREFASFRDAAEIEIQKKGCFPLNEPSFGVDAGEIEELLRRHLSEADAMIQIVGFRYGSEPKGRPEHQPRRSYTQMEYDIARELNIPVFIFLSADPDVRDPVLDEQPEDAEAVQLQLAFRQFLESSNHVPYKFNDKNHLCRLVAGIPLLATADFRVDISRIVEYAPAELVGREEQLALLGDAWLKARRAESRRPHILTFVALGGEGKTSLIAKWAAELAYQNWPGCDSAFAWSFYSQGTREQYAASSDLFLKEAIIFFGNKEDAEFAASNAGAYEKGQRLARIVSQRRSLLILDGLEPLQYAPTSPTPGELKDAGLLALLKSLAADSEGLCIVTTRYSLPNLRAFWQTTAPEVPLLRLSNAAGVHLLKTLGVNGRETEFETLVEDVKGHALTLNLLGTYLRDAHGGDIRRRDLIKLEEADAEEQAGHAFRVMEAYEDAFKNEGEKGKRALSILRLLGLFDRPVSADCLTALLQPPAIAGLTEPLVQSSEAQRNVVLKRLEDAKLLIVNRDESRALVSLDAHPLLREYFARGLRTQQANAWRGAHQRLYEHLYATTPDKAQPTLEDFQPLYHAIGHACQAGLQHEALNNVYIARILRGTRADGFYSWRKLGLFGSNLGALASFFDHPWDRISSSLPDREKAWVLHETSNQLRAIGRLLEAVNPMQAAIEMAVDESMWAQAAVGYGNLSELKLTLGNVSEAIRKSEQAVFYADRSGDAFERMVRRTNHAKALHQAGRRKEAEILFREAEEMQGKRQPDHPLLYSVAGFEYCALLLGNCERFSWQRTLEPDKTSLLFQQSPNPALHAKTLLAVFRRAAQTLDWWLNHFTNPSILSITVENLTLGRTALYQTVLSDTGMVLNTQDLKQNDRVEAAVSLCRSSGKQDYLPQALLTRAWLRFLNAGHIGPESAQEDLDEAWEIAERGPMRLHMADIHLYRARLFFREERYPWGSAREDLAAARKLIEQCGYWRRKEELEDAERVILSQSA